MDLGVRDGKEISGVLGGDGRGLAPGQGGEGWVGYCLCGVVGGFSHTDVRYCWYEPPEVGREYCKKDA